MKTAIVIGATSGIGRALVAVLVEAGYRVCATGRREQLLREVQAAHGDRVIVRRMDVCQADPSIATFSEVAAELGRVDLVVISAGTGHENPELAWDKEKETLDTNVSGFTALAGAAFRLFLAQKSGHLVGISSVAAVRGGPAVSYNASKAFMSSYLVGLRYRVAKTGLPIAITEIRPGFVDTRMAKSDKLFWVSSPERAARCIYRAIERRRKLAYVTPRWALAAWLIAHLPDWLYHRM
jgi:short-subunit dehydrogenase